MQLSKAIAGLDSAVWDAEAKRRKTSVWKMIRGNDQLISSIGIPVYASSISRSVPNETLIQNLKSLQCDFGIQAFKIKIGERMGSKKDLQVVKAQAEEKFQSIRAALGPMCKIGVDVNGGFNSGQDALNVCDTFRHDLWFLEEPCVWFKYSDIRPYSATTPLVAGGEQEFRVDVWQRALENRAFDVAQPDFGYSGGPSVVMQIARTCENLKLGFAPHSPQKDMHPIFAFHVLNAMMDALTNKEFTPHLELGCVDDGNRQVELDEKGHFRPWFCKRGGISVRDGRAYESDTSTDMGWGLEIDEDYVRANATSICEHDLQGRYNIDPKRSFI